MQGDCPFGEGCHFAHGEDELRSFPRQEKEQEQDVELGDNMFSNQENITVDYFQGGASGGGKPCPIVEPEQAHFFIVQSATQKDLALSTVRGEWYVQRRHAEQMNQFYENGEKQVMLFFTVSGSRYIQGAAMMASMATYQEGLPDRADDFCYQLKVEWYRTTELPIPTAADAAPELVLPSRDSSFCQIMTPKTGEKLMKALWNSPLVTLYESWTGQSEPPASEDILTDFRAPSIDEVAWPTMPGAGKSLARTRLLTLLLRTQRFCSLPDIQTVSHSRFSFSIFGQVLSLVAAVIPWTSA
jgi:hypothetical protein